MSAATLVLAAHGSRDPRFAEIVESIAAQTRDLLPGVEVVPAYLEQSRPFVRAVATAGTVVVPLLLSSGYHVLSDLPRQSGGARLAAAVGPDRRLAEVLHERLVQAGWTAEPVTVVAAGSSEPAARAEVATVAEMLAARLAVPVDVGFVSAGEPRLADLAPAAVASYLLAPGFFFDEVRRTVPATTVVSRPLGDHPALAAIAAERYRAAVAKS